MLPLTRCAARSGASKGFFCASIAIAVLAQSASARALDVGAPAPEIGVRDTDGAFISLAELRSNVAIVAFFESSLQTSADLLAGLERIHASHAGEPLMVIAIATDLDRTSFDEFVARRPLPFRVAHDPEWFVVSRYHPRAIPSVFVLDAHGVVRHVQNDASAAGVRELERAAAFSLQSLGVPSPPPPTIPVVVDPGGPGAGWIGLGAVVGFLTGALALGGGITLVCVATQGDLGCLVVAGGGGLAGAVLGSIVGGAAAALAATPETPTLRWSEHAMALRLSF